MSDIPNTEYLTINQKGIFIGGQPAVYYRGEKLHSQSLIKTYFDYIQEKFPIIQEIHVLSSETSGITACLACAALLFCSFWK